MAATEIKPRNDRDRKIGPIFRVEIYMDGMWKFSKGPLVYATNAREIMDTNTGDGWLSRIVVPSSGKLDSTNAAEIAAQYARDLAKIVKEEIEK